ncbi:MAG: hypothetical protein ABSG55_01750 [Dehalococcoidia bacterium]
MAPRKAAVEAPPKKKRSRRRRPSLGQRIGSITLRVVLPGALLAAAIAIVAVFLVGQKKAQAPELRAAIVDQLGLTDPDPAFTQAITPVLEQAGYAVDYVPPEQVDVEFYRHMAEQKYTLIIFRVHIARFTEEGLTQSDPVKRQQILNAFGNEAFLFSSEEYDSSKYTDERSQYRLFAVRNLAGSGDKLFFGIAPQFIQSSMQGKFNNTTVVLMGCDGLTFDTTAKAFVKKGAGVVIGWNDLVSATHTDAAIQTLIPKLASQKLTYGQAISQTMAEIGKDPSYDNALKVYPSDAENRTLLPTG